jgi:hypothetical protein
MSSRIIARIYSKTVIFNFELIQSRENMRNLISLLLLLISISLSGQIRGRVSDKTTGQPIPYANVFLKDKPIGATTDMNGDFEIKTNIENNELIVSAIGYESQLINGRDSNYTILLIPKIYELSEVKISPKKNKSKLIIDSYNKNKIHYYFSCGGYPWIVGKYFKFQPEYKSTPFLKQIKLLTSCVSVDSGVFNLRIISFNEDGTPGVDILDKNLIIKAERGANKNTIIDLSKYNITFPAQGLMIAVEWLIIDQNKWVWKDQVQYLPQFGSVTKEGESMTWTYFGGKWDRNNLIHPNIKNTFQELAIELTLTN